MMSPGVTRPLLAPIRSRLSALRRGTWMPTERFAMRHARDVIRLKSAGMPTREIARRVGTAPSTVRLTIHRFEAAGLTWPLPDDITDAALRSLTLIAAAHIGTQTLVGLPLEPFPWHRDTGSHGRVGDWRARFRSKFVFSCCLALSSASVTASRPCHVSSPRHLERSVRISRSTLSCLFHPKVYGTYPAGATFSKRAEPGSR
ncbi:helix-turn-helix domain-containing protein [Bradyrhizobium sp. USDA 3315]